MQADSRRRPGRGYGIAGRAELLPDNRLDEQPRQFCGKCRPAGGYYVNVMKIDDSDNSYEENYVVTVENGKAIVTGTEQFGEFTPID